MRTYSILLQIMYRVNTPIYNKNRLSIVMHVYFVLSSLHSLGFCYLKALYQEESLSMSTLTILRDCHCALVLKFFRRCR